MMIKRCQAGLLRNSQGCGRLFHLFLVHAFIDHAGYLHIPAKGDPAQAIFGFTDLLFTRENQGLKKR